MIFNVAHFIKCMRPKQVMHDVKTLLAEGKEKRDQETETIKKLLEDTVSALSENLKDIND
jgi:gas vesicle protein